MVEYRVKRFIHAYGADKDGKVSREQFMAKAAERFAQMDRNNDGTISRDERPGRGHGFGRGGPDGGRGGGPGPQWDGGVDQPSMGARGDRPAGPPPGRPEPGKN